jgi:radical SAM protein with 4Fe4S-binding SPASM domain
MTPDAPRQHAVVFELTQRCNHDCLHCYNAWKNELPAPYPSGELGTAETMTLLDKLLDETGASLLTLTGGEPLLRPDLFEIVDALAARGVELNLISNGALLDEAAVARLLPDKISLFELPLLSAERAIHDRLSARAGAFDAVTAAMAELKLQEQGVIGVFVATRLNHTTFHETAELAVALGLDGLMLNRFNPGGTGHKHLEALQLDPTELEALLKQAEQISAEYELPISCSIAMPPCLIRTERFERLSFGFCAAGTARAYYTVDPLGNLRPCNHSPLILGNLLEESFDALANSPAMHTFVDARPSLCAGCALERECLGGCKAAAEACCGSPWAADPFLAAYKDRMRRPGSGRDGG